MQCLKKESFSTLYTLDIQHSYCEERSNLNCLPSSTWEVHTHPVNFDRDPVTSNVLIYLEFRLLTK